MLIFNPPILPSFSFTTFFVVIMFIYILWNVKTLHHISRKCSYIFKYVFIQFIFIFYYLLIAVLSFTWADVDLSVSLRSFSNNVTTFLSSDVVIIGIILYCFKKSISLDQLIKKYISAGLLQSILVILCFVSPAIKNFFNSLTAANSRSERIAEVITVTSEFRNFGFASSLFDIFGYAMCCLAALVLFAGAKNYNKLAFIIFFFVISLSAIVNARTSIVLLAIMISVYFFYNKYEKTVSYQNRGKLLFAFLLITAMIGSATYLSLNNDNAKWIASGIEEIKAFLMGKDIGYFVALKQFLFLPNDFWTILLGTSLPPEQVIMINSDVGYIRNIWSFGIMGSIFLYLYYVKIFYDSYKLGHKEYKSLTIALAIMFFVYLIKLNPIGYSMATVIIIPILQYNICSGYLEKKSIFVD